MQFAAACFPCAHSVCGVALLVPGPFAVPYSSGPATGVIEGLLENPARQAEGLAGPGQGQAGLGQAGLGQAGQGPDLGVQEPYLGREPIYYLHG